MAAKKTEKKKKKDRISARKRPHHKKPPPKGKTERRALRKGLQPGDKAPDFTLPTDGSESITLSQLRGRSVVLYFYPRDDTPGCTREACGFNDALPDFSRVNAQIVGISKDKEANHEKFRRKYGLRFQLAADIETRVAQAYGVWIKKSLYGREYMGMDRATFLIDRTGTIRHVWHGVKVPGHVEEVLAAAKQL